MLIIFIILIVAPLMLIGWKRLAPKSWAQATVRVDQRGAIMASLVITLVLSGLGGLTALTDAVIEHRLTAHTQPTVATSSQSHVLAAVSGHSSDVASSNNTSVTTTAAQTGTGRVASTTNIVVASGQNNVLPTLTSTTKPSAATVTTTTVTPSTNPNPPNGNPPASPSASNNNHGSPSPTPVLTVSTAPPATTLGLTIGSIHLQVDLGPANQSCNVSPNPRVMLNYKQTYAC